MERNLLNISSGSTLKKGNIILHSTEHIVTHSSLHRRAFDSLVMEEWGGWGDEDVTLTILHPDYPDIFDSAKAEEFFHYCLKKFERIRNDNMVEDSEMTDHQDNDADEEEGGDEKLVVDKKVIKKKLPEPTYYREEEPEEEDEDDSEDEDDVKMPMSKLTVKEKRGNF